MSPIPFSLALGGGAARGLAHIGVIRRIEELGVVPVALSGTSMGAIIAAFYAVGYTSDQMRQITMDLRILSLIDLDMRHGVVKGKKVQAFLKKYLGDKTFENVKIPLQIVATDVETGEKIIFTTGNLIDAIRASISIPGAFRPYHHEGRYLIDGGISENLPVSILPPGAVIASSVNIPVSLLKKKKPSKLEFWKHGLIPNTYNIIRRTMAIMMSKNEEVSLASRADVLRIRTERYDLDYYNISDIEGLITSGYEMSGSIEGFLAGKK